MTQFIARAYNRFSRSGATIQKRSNTERIVDEIRYYRSLPEHLRIHFPRLVNHSFDYGDKGHLLELELYAYKNLARPMLGRCQVNDFWDSVFIALDDILVELDSHHLLATQGEIKGWCHSMYIEKTEKEYANLLKNRVFSTIAKHDQIEINGRTYANFHVLWPRIRDYFNNLPIPPKMSVIHGDLCLSNILCGVADDLMALKLIDPRGRFGCPGIFGDPYYDYAKLAHSCDGGYEYFIYDHFTLNGNADLQSFTLGYSCDTKDVVKKAFYELLEDEGIDQLKMNAIQGSIFIGMCARHYDSLERQKAMYLTGVRILNEVMEAL